MRIVATQAALYFFDPVALDPTRPTRNSDIVTLDEDEWPGRSSGRRWQRDEPLPWNLPLPRLVLQPLVENAVLHGISRLPEGGTIELQLVREGNELQIRVRNPAPDPQAPGLALARGAGHAQHSIGHRLAWRFGSAARMTAGWSEGYYACQVTVPIQ